MGVSRSVCYGTGDGQMYRRMIINDLKKNRLVSAAVCIFMAISACFIGLTVLLFASLLGSVDKLMTEAKTCDFLQMHSGDMDQEELKAFAKTREDVEDMLVSSFLNMDNSIISLNGRLLTDSTQDNGFCVQNKNFDYMLGMDNEILKPEEGTVYVPVCYKNEYDLEKGQIMKVCDIEFVIGGFLRDSQMNSMMASSKRFLVNPADYMRLEQYGSTEYLIEFLIKDGYDINAFSTAYGDAGLPCNGPKITAPLIRMMNALSDGVMILVILLVSVVVLIISLICIRYIVITGMEKDRKEAGMLKTLGLSGKDIKNVYILKYMLLSLAGGVAGGGAAFAVSGPLGRQMRMLYGPAGNTAGIIMVSLAGIVLTEFIILCFVRGILGKNDRLSAVEAIRDSGFIAKRKTDSLMWLSVVMAAALFLMLVPLNLASTVSSGKFVSYMGVGQSQIRMDIRQCDDIKRVSKDIYEKLRRDARVERSALMQTMSYRASVNGEENVELLTEEGNHTVFPLKFISGREPLAEGEIALSMLMAQELSCDTGDTILLYRSEKAESYTICGIYSDITNGGKTAKIYSDPLSGITDERPDVIWSIIYIDLKSGEDMTAWINEYQGYFNEYGNSVKIVDIAQYMDGTYGQTIRRIKLAAFTSILVSCLIIFIVILLFTRLKIWQEKKDIVLKKAIGVSCYHIRRDYLVQTLFYILAGILTGIVMGIVPGQMLAGKLMGMFGAAGFRFILDRRMVYLIIPFISLIVAILGVRTATREAVTIKITPEL